MNWIAYTEDDPKTHPPWQLVLTCDKYYGFDLCRYRAGKWFPHTSNGIWYQPEWITHWAIIDFPKENTR